MTPLTVGRVFALLLFTVFLSTDSMAVAPDAGEEGVENRTWIMRVQRLFQTPTPVGNGPGIFIYSPITTFRGHVYYTWFDKDRRPQIVQIFPNGDTIVEAVEQPDYQGHPDGHHRLSLGVDGDGYIHIAGDMHGGVNDRKLTTDRFAGANVLYWRSSQPEDVRDFEFLGLDADRTIPMPNATYAFFLRDRKDELYFAGRIVANPDRKAFPESHRGVGLYHYNAEEERWIARGGTENPVNGVALEKTLFNSVNEWGNLPSASTPIWYRWNMVGLGFDQNNKLHFAVNANTPFGEGTHLFYAASVDGGVTWQRANGSAVELPMIDSLTPHSHRPDLVFAPRGKYLSTQGPTYPFFNDRGEPGVSVSMKVEEGKGNQNAYLFWNPEEGEWSEVIESPIAKGRHWTNRYFLGRDGAINFFAFDRLYRTSDFQKEGQEFALPGSITSLDPIALLEENVLIAVLQTGADRAAIYRLDFFEVSQEGWKSRYIDLEASPLDTQVAQLEAGGMRIVESEDQFRPDEVILDSEWKGLLAKVGSCRSTGFHATPGSESGRDWEEGNPGERSSEELSRSTLASRLYATFPHAEWPEVKARWTASVAGEINGPEQREAAGSLLALGVLPESWNQEREDWNLPVTRAEAVEAAYRFFYRSSRVVPTPIALEDFLSSPIKPSQHLAEAHNLVVKEIWSSNHSFRKGPDHLIDGDAGTVFEFRGDQFVEIELEGAVKVGGITFSLPERAGEKIGFQVFAEMADGRWRKISEGIVRGQLREPSAFDVSEPTSTRKLRLYLFAPEKDAASVVGIEIFGSD